MANLRLNLDKAMFEKLNITAVINVATGGVFNTLAPKGATAPYVIFQAMSKLDDHSFSGRFANSVYMVKAVSRHPWPKEALDIDTQIDTALEDVALTITGYTHLLCRRESDIYLVEEDAGAIWHHIGGLYRIMADQT